MPKSTPDEPDAASDQEAGESVSNMNLDQWIETLRRSDRSLYNLIALEAWAIAQTMDGLIPGFWSRFMENRRIALKQFMQHQKTQPGKEGKE